MNDKLEGESQLQAELRVNNIRVGELGERLEEVMGQLGKVEAELKRKQMELKRTLEKLNEVEINYKELFTQQ